jgi:hypothetical protein
MVLVALIWGCSFVFVFTLCLQTQTVMGGTQDNMNQIEDTCVV